jgi:hypothetical protein
MNCEKTKELILSDAESDEKLEAHISSCAECRNIASAWSSLKDTRPKVTPEPSGNIDFKIRAAAALFLDNKKIHHTVFVRRIFMYATAACCVFVTWLALDNIDHQSRTQKNRFVSSGTIPWSHIDMEKDFFELIAELELSIENIYTGSDANSRNEKEIEVSIPDLST